MCSLVLKFLKHSNATSALSASGAVYQSAATTKELHVELQCALEDCLDIHNEHLSNRTNYIKICNKLEKLEKIN